jgi:coiled-coil domain-containing protein 12
MGDRKARLAALAAKAGRSKPTSESSEDVVVPAAESTNEQTSNDDNKETKAVAFRNYAPKDATLQEAGDNDDEPASKKQRTEDTAASSTTSKSVLQQALEEAKRDTPAATADVEQSAPKKINWDLKRDIAPKLEKLEKRTQRAIIVMLKERLESEASAQTGTSDSDLD